jgi:hypothetical protein
LTEDLLPGKYTIHTEGRRVEKMNKENEKEAERECGRECLDCPIKNDDNIQ